MQKAPDGPPLSSQKALDGPPPSSHEDMDGLAPTSQEALDGLPPSSQEALDGSGVATILFSLRILCMQEALVLSRLCVFPRQVCRLFFP